MVALSRLQPGDTFAERSWCIGLIRVRDGVDRLVFTTVPDGQEPEAGEFRAVNAMAARSLRERPR